MARTPSVPRRPAGRPRVVPPVVPDPVVDLQPVDDNPPVIDDEVPVPVPVDVPVIEVAAPREDMRVVQELLRGLLPVLAPQVAAAGQPPPPPPPPLPDDGMIDALMLCGFDLPAAEALQKHGMSSIDFMSVMDTANFTTIATQVTRFVTRNTMVLPLFSPFQL
jgi:hypothetical protein